MLKNIIKIMLILFLASICFIKIAKQRETKIIEKYISNQTKYNYLNYEVLEIPKINLLEKLEKNKNNFSNLDSSLVYYEDLNYNNRIIIFGHSGMGYNTYFNRLNELKLGNYAYLYYDKYKLYYSLNKIYIVDKYDTSIMYDTVNKKELVLITCVKNNKNKRLLLKFGLKTVKIIEK